ncbi:MAG TPA: FAD-binding oxidoreductase [Noviherbaspirillum sp.]|uniref:FAD-binding oxidoreductase n=1 Tax=Noviherbaspirillum sp. TaxID=1926288 RepID=UPI002B46A6C3|nr:FAD-binding oxidoreductase [Noviherbaspirillum sp.]HJV85608.1 FAD-binding oxidoreductase [Noviherbaspirillum sp.]
MNDFLQQCRTTIGAAHVITDPSDMAGHLTDWRKRFTGKALAVVKPGSTEEVAAVVRLCNQFRVPVVPQGGNTGLVLGSVPDQSGNAIVLSLTRLNRIRAVDTINNTMTVESGCILEQVQNAASDAGRLFPLSLAAEGSCTIGGNLSTNAGGTAVLRYGNTRELCLGLEVVTAQGEVWNGLRGLRKDNTGYDLRDLFIGAEGTLGIITAAVLKVFPQPKAQLTALAAMPSPDDALRLLSIAQEKCGPALTGFELMSDFCLRLVNKHYPHMRLPFPQNYSQYVLLELSDNESEEHANAMLEDLITVALEQAVIQDAAVASSIAQSKALWSLREHIPLAQADEGKNIKHDISVPISRIGDFIRTTDVELEKNFPGCRMVTFGHLGDGNLHYNVSPPEHGSPDAFIAHQTEINRVVHDSVHRFGGSISAEHGLGALKRNEIMQYKSELEMNLMRTIKQALDPLGLMNPGKVV